MEWKRYLIGNWSWKRLLRSVVSVYLILLVIAVFFAEKLIFFPPEPGYTAATPGLVMIATPKEKIAAVYLPADPGKPTILYAHGNAEDLSAAMELYDEWHQAGLGILAYDFPGYGLSGGTPTESSCERAAQAGWDFLTVGKKIAPSSIVIAARSVGGGPAVWLAAHEKPRGLVLVSSFTSAFAVRIPIPIFPRDRFPSLKRIHTIDCPLLVIHGEQDSLIRISHGRALYEASPAKDKRFIAIAGAGHDDLFAIGGPVVTDTIAEFALKGGN
ncbi:MAG: phospholipase/Carboxylesterase [Akkermansiaceae bacterium]|nr:phospholipase/Carboxylesterase [Akkermansiaceae bacterium]